MAIMTSPQLPTSADIDMIVLDVDGTLLTRDHRLHPKTISAIEHIRQTRPQLPIVIASGKQKSSCAWIRERLALPDTFPAIHCNGCIIYSGPDGAISHLTGPDPEITFRLVEEFGHWQVFLFTPDDCIAIQRKPAPGPGERDWVKFALGFDKAIVEEDGDEILPKVRNGETKIAKVTIATETTDMPLLMNAISKYPTSKVRATRAIPEILEVMPPDGNKLAGVKRLCVQLGLRLDRVLAFGDGENDADMLRWVGHGVAMGNAMQAASEAAKYVTTTSDEGGVGEFLDRIFR